MVFFFGGGVITQIEGQNARPADLKKRAFGCRTTNTFWKCDRIFQCLYAMLFFAVLLFSVVFFWWAGFFLKRFAFFLGNFAFFSLNAKILKGFISWKPRFLRIFVMKVKISRFFLVLKIKIPFIFCDFSGKILVKNICNFLYTIFWKMLHFCFHIGKKLGFFFAQSQ